MINIPDSEHKRIVIVGGGFAGIELAKKLRNEPVQVVLLDKNNFFTFQPLLYQVATSGLEPNSIAYPLRRLFRGASNVFFRLAEVQSVDTSRKEIQTTSGELDYDYLVLATGSAPNFFGLDNEKLIPLKSVRNALDMRNVFLKEFEEALTETDERKRQTLVNIVIVGAGPTGVELAGALGEMKKYVLPKDYPELDIERMQIYLLEGADRVLPTMSKQASAKAHKFLEELGVTVYLKKLVKQYDGKKVTVEDEEILTQNLVWTAGVQGGSLEGIDADNLHKNNRIIVDEYNRVQGHNSLFAVGDVAHFETEDFPNGLPMLAPVAMQQGRHLGKNFLRELKGKEMEPFEYFDKGTMATVGRNRAVVDIHKFKFQGTFAWFVWMFVHLVSLVGFRNKLVVVINWIYNYFTYDRALRLIINASPTKEKKLEKIVE